MGALKRVSAMIRFLPGTWAIVKLHVSHHSETKSLHSNQQLFKVFHAEQWHQRLAICVDVK